MAKNAKVHFSYGHPSQLDQFQGNGGKPNFTNFGEKFIIMRNYMNGTLRIGGMKKSQLRTYTRYWKPFRNDAFVSKEDRIN